MKDRDQKNGHSRGRRDGPAFHMEENLESSMGFLRGCLRRDIPVQCEPSFVISSRCPSVPIDGSAIRMLDQATSGGLLPSTSPT